MNSLRRSKTITRRPSQPNLFTTEKNLIIALDWSSELLKVGLNSIESVRKRRPNSVLELNLLILTSSESELKSKIISKWLRAGGSLKIHELIGEGSMREKIATTIGSGNLNDVLLRSEISGLAFVYHSTTLHSESIESCLEFTLDAIAQTFLPGTSFYSPAPAKSTVPWLNIYLPPQVASTSSYYSSSPVPDQFSFVSASCQKSPPCKNYGVAWHVLSRSVATLNRTLPMKNLYHSNGSLDIHRPANGRQFVVELDLDLAALSPRPSISTTQKDSIIIKIIEIQQSLKKLTMTSRDSLLPLTPPASPPSRSTSRDNRKYTPPSSPLSQALHFLKLAEVEPITPPISPISDNESIAESIESIEERDPFYLSRY